MAGDQGSSGHVDTSDWFTWGDPQFLDPDLNWAGRAFHRRPSEPDNGPATTR